MIHYKLLLAVTAVSILMLSLSACTVTTVSYGIPYGNSSTFSPDAKYGHYRPAFGYQSLPSQFLPNER